MKTSSPELSRLSGARCVCWGWAGVRGSASPLESAYLGLPCGTQQGGLLASGLVCGSGVGRQHPAEELAVLGFVQAAFSMEARSPGG